MQPNTAPTPPVPPIPPIVPGLPSQVQIIAPIPGAGPSNVYRALREQRSELQDQLQSLESKRENLQGQLQETKSGESRSGIEARIKEIDARISKMDAGIADANAAVAAAAAVPGAVVQDPPRVRTGPPEEVFVLSGLFMIVVLLPISIAYARRIWRRGKLIITPVPPEVRAQIDRLTDAVETIGLEVERIGEGQRFITHVFAEQKIPVVGPARGEAS